MFGQRRVAASLIFSLALAFVVSCGDEDASNLSASNVASRGQTNVAVTDFRCIAEGTPNIVNAATQRRPRPDQMVTLRVYAYNGSGRYRIPNYINEFAASTTVTGGYYNWTNQDTVRGAVVNVVDIVTGRTTSCNFSVTVRPASRPDSTINPNFAYCSITGPDYPIVGAATNYQIDLANVPQPYQFADFMLDYQVRTPVARVSDVQGKAAVTFQYPGLQKAFVDIIKDGRVVAYCEKLVFARFASAVTLVASSTYSEPGTAASKAITVEAFTHNFMGTPNVVYNVDRPEVILVQDGNKLTVNSRLAQTVRVTATATLGGDTATAGISLVFGNQDPGGLNCRITHTLQSDSKTIKFSINPVGSSESLVVTEFNHDGVLTSGLGQDTLVRYDTQGFKAVSAKAHASGDPSRRCNAGNLVYDSVMIGTMGCSVFTSPNPSPVTGKVLATVVPYGISYGNLRIKNITSTAGSTMIQGATHGNLTRELTFNSPGIYTVDVTVEDTNTLGTATCSSRHIVTYDIPQCLATFYYLDGTQVTSPRVREDVYARIDSSLRHGYIKFFPGGEVYSAPSADVVWFPAKANVPLSYVTPGFKNAGFLVASPWGYTTMCSGALSVQPGLSCNVNTTTRKTLAFTTNITSLASATYPGASTSVTHTIAVKNEKPTVVYSVSGDNFTTSTSPSVTASFNRHGTFNVSATVTDARDRRGATCSSATVIDLEQTVSIVKAGGNYAWQNDTVSITFTNTSSSAVTVTFKANSQSGPVEESRVVPANGSITTQNVRRNNATQLFDFMIVVSGSEPKTADALKATVNAAIDGASYTYTLNPL